MLIDSHCHLDRLELGAYAGGLRDALEAAQRRGVEKFLCVGISVQHRERVLAIAEQYDAVVASVGVHPLDVDSGLASAAQLADWARHPKIVAIGETGLDYYYSEDTKQLQQRSFVTHLEAAGAASLPVIVHTRDAREDTLNLIREHGDLERGGVLHCFTEDWHMAARAMDMNYLISISGIVTFRNAAALRDVVKRVPLDRLLVETDSPYLAPVPYRGKPNEPRYVREVAEFVAELKEVSYDTLVTRTAANFFRLFPRARTAA